MESPSTIPRDDSTTLPDTKPRFARSTSASTFLLLTQAPSTSAAVAPTYPFLPLPRPRLWPLIPLVAALDLFGSIWLGFALYRSAGLDADGGDRQRTPPVAVKGSLEEEWALIVWALVRAIIVGAVGLSRRVREFGGLVGLTSAISILLVLYRLDELIQYRPIVPRPYHSDPALLSSFVPSFAVDTPFSILIDPPNRRRLPIPQHLHLRLTIHLLVFSIIHWLTYVLLIGVSRRRNPFGLGFGLTFRPSGLGGAGRWSERVCDLDTTSIREVDEPDEDEITTEGRPAGLRRSVSHSYSIRRASSSRPMDEEAGALILSPDPMIEEEEDIFSSEEDPDDIIDMPPPSSCLPRPSSTSPIYNQNRGFSSSSNLLESESPSGLGGLRRIKSKGSRWTLRGTREEDKQPEAMGPEEGASSGNGNERSTTPLPGQAETYGTFN